MIMIIMMMMKIMKMRRMRRTRRMMMIIRMMMRMMTMTITIIKPLSSHYIQFSIHLLLGIHGLIAPSHLPLAPHPMPRRCASGRGTITR
jgi:hypothetical protein